jgi:heme A synthase
MNDNKSYIRYTQFILVFVFLVILAGGIVRTTQSGMGCPDWPRCFGRWVPPVSEDQLPVDFEKYLSKQDIDHTFNVYHTWIEYINRLLGAVLGLLIIVHVFWSYRKYFKTRSSIFWLSLFLLLLTGFQGWLGKRVVDANLAVVKITTHMLNYQQREVWISRLNNFFTLHRTFAWVVALLGVYLFWRSLGVSQLQKPAVWVFILILASMLLGLSMMYLHIPALAQPLHLLFSCILAIVLFAYFIRFE